MRHLSCILIALAIVGVYGDEPDKLVNGIAANIADYPHAVSLRINNDHFCGGSIISDRYILTAAHCVRSLETDARSRQAMTIVTGTTYLNSGGQAYKVERIWSHAQWDPNFPSGRGPYDIGLIKSASSFQFGPNAQPIKLPTRDIAANEDVTIAAWGSTGFRQSIHNNLQKLFAKAMLPNDCQRYHQNSMPIAQSEMCTLITYGTGLCNGDSGSGLLRNSDRTLVGLVSGGRPCAMGYPDVYTKVYSYLPWINQRMQ